MRAGSWAAQHRVTRVPPIPLRRVAPPPRVGTRVVRVTKSRRVAEACQAMNPPPPEGFMPCTADWKALKIVSYAGASPLPQLPWRSPWDAPILLISLFDGIGGALLALTALGMSFAAVAIECNEEASAVVRAAFRNVQTIKNAEDFQAEAMLQVIQSGRFSLVLVMGGSPCQQVSRLNPSRAGLRSAESLLFRHVPRVASEFSEVISDSGLSIPVLCILENVEYASADFAEEVARCMSGPPLVVHGGSFGYVRRSRCFWISDGI